MGAYSVDEFRLKKFPLAPSQGSAGLGTKAFSLSGCLGREFGVRWLRSGQT